MRRTSRAWVGVFAAIVVLVGTTASAARVTDGLLHVYTFDEGQDTTAGDSVGTNPGTLYNMDPATDWVSGIIGSALDFDGANDYVRTDNAMTVPRNSFSMSAWFKTTSSADDKILHFDPNDVHPLQITSGTLRTCTGSCVAGGPNVNDDTWHLGVVTGDGSASGNIKVYLDGNTTPVITATSTTGTVSGQLYVASGGTGPSAAYMYTGQLDEIGIWDRPLTPSEIGTLYAAGQAGYGIGSIAAPTANTAPGGIETTAYSSSLLYWLKADAGITVDGSNKVSAWADQSSEGNDFAQATAGIQPELVAGAMGGNGLPTLRFDGDQSGDYATIDKLVLSTATRPETIIIVNTPTGFNGLDGIIGRDGADKGIRRIGSNEWRHATSGSPADINDFTYNNGHMSVNGTPNTGVAPLGTPHILATTRDPAHDNDYVTTALGQYFYSAQRSYRGDIAEVIVYDRALNDAELQIVENHLSAKYDIPLAANNHYSGDDPAAGDYDLDVFGIGRVDAANQVTLAGSAGFAIDAAASSLGDGEWLMAGHKTPANSLTTADVPAGEQRWSRVWHLDKTGSVDASLTFDQGDAGGIPTAGPATQYALLYSPTNAFAFSEVAATPAVDGDQISFQLADGQMPDGYYTVQETRPVPVNGPGGFEATDGSSSLRYWLKADENVMKDAAGNVSEWQDITGNNNDFTQANAINQPVLQTATLGGNNLPAIRFDGDNSDPDDTGPLPRGANADELVLNTAITARTVFIVNSTFQNRSLDGIWGRHNSDYGIRRESSAAWQHPGNANTFSFTGSMYVNGAATNAAALNTPHILTTTGSGSYPATSIGDYFVYGHAAGDRSWNGDIGEVIVYDRALNTAETHIVENHLSAKYDIAMAANDRYAGDDAARGDYDLDVIGIGRVDAGNQATAAANAGLGLSALGGLGDDEWLLAGHKTLFNSWSTDDVPPIVVARWDRVWYLDMTGDLDALITFDHAAGSLVAPDLSYTLLYSAENAFDFERVGASYTIDGDLVSFAVRASALRDGYYTLGVVPEPTTLSLLGLGGLALLRRRRRHRA